MRVQLWCVTCTMMMAVTAVASPGHQNVEWRTDGPTAQNGGLDNEFPRTDADRGFGPESAGGFTPNDALYPIQWGLEAIGAPGAWEITLGTHNVTIAILDSGIDAHPDLYGNHCGPNASFAPGPPGYHGTHVAGIAGAVTNNGIGVAGVSQSCLMSVKIDGYEEALIQGIRWATINGADIISMSVGFFELYQPSQALEDVVNQAYANDVLLVAAAGRQFCMSESTISWPARFPAVVAVGALAAFNATTRHDQSSCGDELEISAPGENITSTVPGGGYAEEYGTSMATPHVAGVAALMKSVAPNIGAREIRSILNETADDILDVGWDRETGWGRLNATAAVARALELYGEP